MSSRAQPPESRLALKGVQMKKLILSVATAVALATPALAADLRLKAPPPPAPPPNPWDIAFGAGIASDYIFRGITQSNHKPSASVYFEPRYNITPYLQLYAGVAGESISFPNRAAARSTATSASGRPSVRSPSISAVGTTGILAGPALMAVSTRSSEMTASRTASCRSTAMSSRRTLVSGKPMRRPPTR